MAVHGLSSGQQSTWLETKSDIWLKDFLPMEIPTARVLPMSYNLATVTDSTNALAQRLIQDEANNLLRTLRTHREGIWSRPIIFICHSIGGLVVKQVSNQILGMMSA